MMDRKKTILIAVLINAGLLVVLFIAALTTKEETVSEISQIHRAQERLSEPLFTEPVDLGVRPPPLAEIPIEAPAVTLPPLIAETPPILQLPASASPPRLDPGFIEVTVKKGESLDKIAKAHQTSVDELIKMNHLPSSFLKVGQVLKVPSKKTAIAEVSQSKTIPETSSAEFYTVKVGDNPWTIAMKHHMKVDELLKLNGLNEEKARKLKPGDRLRTR